MPQQVRILNPCDGCTLRRVKCEDKRPCHQCHARNIQCTSLQTRQKRGPKRGPRHATSTKIREFQKGIRHAPTQTPSPEPLSISPSTSSIDGTKADGKQDSSSPSDWSPVPTSPPSEAAPGRPLPQHAVRVPSRPPTVHPTPIVMEDYEHFINIFHQRAFQIWPVVNSDDLLAQLSHPDPHPETLALAASLCAATIAQLRLEQIPAPNARLPSQFATECLWFRERYDWRETCSTASILIPFFLHIYYANTNKLRTAGLFLREAITYIHAMELDQPQTYQHLDKAERSLQLRIYWLLFISERTYCVQNLIPAILRPIDIPPEFEDGAGDEGLSLAFTTLSRLFVYLESDFATRRTATTAATTIEPNKESSLERHKVVSYQTDLSLFVPGDADATHEAQRVDLFVTRQWIRLLLWEFTSRHFPMACRSADEAFSLFLPVRIGHELLSLFSTVTDAAVKTHGYGMELKVFRLADTLLDLMVCASVSATRKDMMLATSGDILYSFREVLMLVGGHDSTFLRKLHFRMSQLELDTGAWPYHRLPGGRATADDDETEGGFQDCCF